jgi:hypothetical protein
MEMRIFQAIAVVTLLAASGAAAVAQENSGRSCPIDTTTDKDTGKPRTSGTGVQVCGEGGSGSVGVSVSQEELEHFLKYPIGQSDKSVAKQIGNAVHHFFSHF